MAEFAPILGAWPPGDVQKVAALGAAASSGELVIGAKTIFAIVGDGAFNIRFGAAGMAAASATDFFVPANQIVTLDMTSAFDRIRIFNPGAAAQNYFIAKPSRF